MPLFRSLLAVVAVTLTTTSTTLATPILFGTVGEGSNLFPFGGPAAGFTGTEYQQVYNANQFSAAVSVNSITFFNSFSSGQSFLPGTYTISFSTTSKAVNGLDTTNLANNFGTNTHLFATLNLSGTAGSPTITFTGTPYAYNPAAGNLLMDITYSGAGGNTGLFLDAMNGDFGTLSSRAHNYGTGFAGFGLVTQFDVGPQAAVPEPASLAVVGFGLGVLAFRLRRPRAQQVAC